MPWQPLPTGSPDPVPVRESLDAVMERLSGASVSAIETIMESWPAIVGGELGAATAPVKVAAGCLTVRTTDAIWATEIRWLEATIIERVRALSDGSTIDRVQVVVRPGS